QDRRRDVQLQALRSAQVQDQLKSCRPLNWQFGGVATLQYFFNHNPSLPIHLQEVYTVSQQTARAGEIGKQSHGGKPVVNGKLRERLRVRSDQWRRQHERGIRGSPSRSSKGFLEVGPRADLENVHLDGQRACRMLQCNTLSCRGG